MSSMLCRPTPKSDAYPILQNAVECSDAELIDFAELLILNLKDNVMEYKCQSFCFVKDSQAADWFFRCEDALAAYIGR